MNLPYFDLTGKTAIITGGATGIGKGIAEGLADAGANIVITSRRLDKCKEAGDEIVAKTGVKALPVSCDINVKQEIDHMVEAVRKEFGHIDILVNNSGIGGSEKPILKMSEEDWDSVMNTNLKAILTVSRAVVKVMVEQGAGGKIINLTSILGQIASANMAAYCASKSAAIHLTKVMALEWAKYNIQVNTLLPGYVETPMNTEFFSSEMGEKFIRKQILMQRLAQPEELKGAAILMASPASSFMTGSALVVDGGQTCL